MPRINGCNIGNVHRVDEPDSKLYKDRCLINKNNGELHFNSKRLSDHKDSMEDLKATLESDAVDMLAAEGSPSGKSHGFFRRRKSLDKSLSQCSTNVTQPHSMTITTIESEIVSGDTDPAAQPSLSQSTSLPPLPLPGQSAVAVKNDDDQVKKNQSNDSRSSSISPLLLRLFQSNLFTFHMALQYLVLGVDRNHQVLAYITTHKLPTFAIADIDLYLLQLVSLFHLWPPELARHLGDYFLHRCLASPAFAIHLVWLLDTLLEEDDSFVSIVASCDSVDDGGPPNQSSLALRNFLLPSNTDILGRLMMTGGCDLKSQHRLNRRPLSSTDDVAAAADNDAAKTRGAVNRSLTQSSWSCQLPLSTSSTTSNDMEDQQSSTSHPVSEHEEEATSREAPLSSDQRSSTTITTNKHGAAAETVAATNISRPTSMATRHHKRVVSDLTNMTTWLSISRPIGQASRTTPSSEDGRLVPNTSSSLLGRDNHHDNQQDATDARRPQTLSTDRRQSTTNSSAVMTSQSEPSIRSLALGKNHRCRAPDDSQTSASSTNNQHCNRLSMLRLYLIPRLIPEWDFVQGLQRIARELVPIGSKERRTVYLQAELANMNLQLPARVWLPVNKADHIVLRIPPASAVCLNSKDKAPYLLYLEVLECADPWSVELPSRAGGSNSSTVSLSAANRNSNLGGDGSRSSSRQALSTDSQQSPGVSDEGDRRQDAIQPAPSYSSMTSSGLSLSISPYTSSQSQLDTAVVTGSSSVTKPAEFVIGSSMNNIVTNDAAPSGESGETDDNDSAVSSSVNTVTATTDVVDRHQKAAGEVDEGPLFVAAGDIRSRLEKQSDRPSFQRDPEDPSAAVLKEPWDVKCRRLQQQSPWGHLAGWSLTAVIVKVGDDLRQEQLAYQLLGVLQRVWRLERVPLWLRPLTVIVTSPDSGLIEPVRDTVSLHQIKRLSRLSLLDYFIREHGSPSSEAFLSAQLSFVESCAAYCLVSYILQVKDRHNGNILIDNQGHMIHIDYGFILSVSPGRNIGFEPSTFKLTGEHVAVMGGEGSDFFEYFKTLLLKGLLATKKHFKELTVLIDLAHKTYPQLPCFGRAGSPAASTVVTDLERRLFLTKTEDEIQQRVIDMVKSSLDSIRTRLYDHFQYYANGIQ